MKAITIKADPADFISIRSFIISTTTFSLGMWSFTLPGQVAFFIGSFWGVIALVFFLGLGGKR